MPPFLLFAGKKVAQSFGFAAFKKAGKFYFLQSSQTKGRGVLLRLVTPVLSAAVCKSSRIRRSRILGLYAGFLFYQRLVPKPENSAKPNSRTVCRFPSRYAFSPLIPAVWGFGLGLLGGQGFIGAKASLDPLCRAFLI